MRVPRVEPMRSTTTNLLAPNGTNETTLMLRVLAFAATLTIALAALRTVRAAQVFVVSARSTGELWRIEDANGDRDALDIGERMLWASGFNSPQGMTSNGRVVYVAEEGFADGSNQVVRLLDVNGDADALDVGERSIWLNGLDDPADVSYDGSAWFLSEVDEEQIFRLTDVNDDGDVLDIGERALYADDIGAPQHILTQSGSLIVPSFTGDQINRLRDANNDGDALDVGENNVVIVQNFGGLAGVLDDGAGGFFFTSLAVDAVYHARDVNGDSDMLDIGEVLPYADPVYGWLNDPTGLVATATGFLLADSLNNQIKLVHDLNGDGDALDFGDVIVFADGIVRPHDIVALQITPPSDFNIDGNVDVADYVAWQKLGGTSAQYYAWTSTFGETAVTSGTSNGTVPEPDGAALFWTLAAAALGWKSAGRTSHARCAV